MEGFTKDEGKERVKTIHINQSVKGAFEGTTGYVDMASTPGKWAYVPALLEDKHGQNKLSPDYASLFAYRESGLNSLVLVHVQGQHNGNPGRMYDTRIFYEIGGEEVRNCGFNIGEIANSLPRMKKYQEIEKGKLNNSLQVEKIQGYDKIKANNLAEHIMQSIINCKYLLIHLDDDKLSWKENGVLENEVARTLFAAIDMLPEKLRPLASFALSIDKNYNTDWLSDKLIMLYHGDKTDFGFTRREQIEWKDLEQKPTTDYVNQSEKYSKEASKLMGGASDFYHTNLSFASIIKTLKSNLENPK